MWVHGSRPEGERSGRRVVPGDGGVPRENFLGFGSSIPPLMTFFVNYKQVFLFAPSFNSQNAVICMGISEAAFSIL